MHAIGIALFLFAAAPNAPQPAMATPPAMVAASQSPTQPDHAPPHPLTPRVHFESPAAALERAFAELAKNALRSLGH